MSLHVRHGGAWKLAEPHVRDNGVWKPVLAAYVRDKGAWKLVHGATDWDDINGSMAAENAAVTMPFSDTVGISVTVHGGYGAIFYTLNGGPTGYSAPFEVAAGDRLSWGAQTKGGYLATVTVYRTGPTVIDTFEISLL